MFFGPLGRSPPTDPGAQSFQMVLFMSKLDRTRRVDFKNMFVVNVLIPAQPLLGRLQKNRSFYVRVAKIA